MQAKILAFAVRKGGSGKTTTALNVSSALSKMGKKILLVDFDPQSDLTSALGFTEEQVETSNVYQYLVNKKLSYFKINDNLSLAPSYEDLDDAEATFANAMAKEFELKRVLSSALNDFDYIIIDCPPSTGFLTRNALACADYVFIPVQSHVFSNRGLVKMINKVNEIKSKLNPNLKIGGVFATIYDRRNSVEVDSYEQMKLTAGSAFIDTAIRRNTSLVESPAFGKDIFDYKENSTGADDYFALTNEILKRIS
jgi:chromosome partitioning protein